nr:replication protein [uncultured Enterobacter sp.]
MENQKTGFIPLYRSVLKQGWARDVFLRTLWDNLLLSAARQPYTASYKGRQWPLQTGQLVTTTADLGLALCDRNGEPTSRHAVDRMLAFFEKEGMITAAGERRKGTVITITNYAQYAQKMDDLPAHYAAHNSEHNPAHNEPSNGAACEGDAANNPAHKGALKSAHHEQQVILNTNVFNDPSRISKIHPGAAIQTPKGDKWGTAADLKCAEWILALRSAIKPSLTTPNLTTWANDVRMLRQLDHHSHREICELFKWAAHDSFWHKNILSPSKLRKQWDTLTLHRADSTRKPRAEEPSDAPHWNSPEAWEDFV